MFYVVSLVASLVAAQYDPPKLTPDQMRAATTTRFLTLSGIFFYQEGDYIVYECGGSLCADLLIRDSFLEANAVNLIGKKISLVVERVVACPKNGENTYVCFRSSNGSALKIRNWISPR